MKSKEAEKLLKVAAGARRAGFGRLCEVLQFKVASQPCRKQVGSLDCIASSRTVISCSSGGVGVEGGGGMC